MPTPEQEPLEPVEEKVPSFTPTWAAEALGKSEHGHVVKVQVTFEEEPHHDQEAVVRSQVQAVMRRQYAAWCNQVTYRKWAL